MVDNIILSEVENPVENGWIWSTFEIGGALKVSKKEGSNVVIYF
jgi:hypothetical protein